MDAGALEAQLHALKGQFHLSIRLHAGHGIQALAQLRHIGEDGKLIFQRTGQKVCIQVVSLDQPGGEQKALPDKYDLLSGGTHPKFVLVLAHLSQPAQRGGGDQDAEVSGALVVPLSGDDAVAVAPGGPQAVLGKPEVDTLEHGLLVLFISSKHRPPGHGGDTAGPDQVGHSGNFCLGVAAPLPDGYAVLGVAALNDHPAVSGFPFQFHGLAGQLLQHPSQQLGVDDQGVVLLGVAGQLLLQRDLQVGGGEHQRLAGSIHLQAHPLQDLQG